MLELPSPTTPHDSRTVQHQYGTRIRQNSVIKPSARLRQSPDPPLLSRKVKPIPRQAKSTSLERQPLAVPVFPPPHVVLHPEDANSKVFLAIGRSFLSVDNRAMTIKDLAEMTLKYGLLCQNVSAAGQAITTYIRSHMQRCDAQEDHPLLLRHTLSGTASDDDLLPALHSRAGGAHTATPDNRITNFRRGTMVWYLSKVTGAPCPFARAGIRLCEYGENGKVDLGYDPKDGKKDRGRSYRQETCGQKRKRLLRGCTAPDSDSDSAVEDRPPPKVKLTLRLRPSLVSTATAGASARLPSPPTEEMNDLSPDSDSIGSDDDLSSVDSSDDEDTPAEPYVSFPRPPFTPATGSSPSHWPDPPIPRLPSNDAFRRSPSVPRSIASPPPNSDDDDYNVMVTGFRRSSPDRLRDRGALDDDTDWDLDLESDGEGDGETETQWESPGPRSPSAPIPSSLSADIVVKQEARDVQGMLDAWDDFDCSMADGKLISRSPLATSGVKMEMLDQWDWQGAYLSTASDWSPPTMPVENMEPLKQEECDLESMLMSPYDVAPPPLHDYDPISPLSPLSTPSPNCSDHVDVVLARRHSESSWNNFDSVEGSQKLGSVRDRARTSASLPSLIQPSTSNTSTHPSPFSPPATIRGRDSDLPTPPPPPPPTSAFLATLIQSMTMSSLETQNDTVAPLSLLMSSGDFAPDTHYNHAPDVVVVHTCQPCTPTVSATQIEGISVYQMTLGTALLLRRIDTDFVNISPIANYLGIPPPLSATTPNAVVIGKGSATVSGTWVPLASAQAFVRDHPISPGLLDIFLSDTLFERFPPALQDFHRSNAPGRRLNQFGPHFSSTTMEAQRQPQLSLRTDLPSPNTPRPPVQPQTWGRELPSKWDIQDMTMATSLGQTSLDNQVVDVAETPLSATEQEMFHALCAIPDWEKEVSPPGESAPAATVDSPPRHESPSDVNACDVNIPPPSSTDKPLRRSKRVAIANAVAVANAVAAKTRASSRRRSARNSMN